MNYRLEISIHKPRSQVWQVFTDPGRIKLWQPSLSTVALVSGTPGQPGAISTLMFQENQREFSLTETITFCQAPERIHQKYENQFSVNTVKNLFIEQGQNETLWITETEYKFKTLLMKILGPLYKKNFAARTLRDMESFKKIVEME